MSAVFAPLFAENSLFESVGKIFHPIFEIFGYLLAGIYVVVPNYALSIAILTVIIMAALTPLTVKSVKSMVAMQRLQPEMKKLQQKYKGAENREQLNAEMMKLYKESGTSPVGSCLPMFLQMPFLIVLYNLIKGLTNTVKPGVTTSYGSKCVPPSGYKVCASPRYIPPESHLAHNLAKTPGEMVSFGVNLADKPFSSGLTVVEHIPYFILMAIAIFLQYYQMKQMNSRNPQAMQANPQMQTMQKIMPILFAYIYIIVPAAVTIYMIVSSAIRIGTQEFMFRTGRVTPVSAEREIGGTKKAGEPEPKPPGKGTAKAIEAGGAAAATGPGAKPKGGSNGSRRAAAKGPSTNGTHQDSASTNGASTDDDGEGKAKPHPRSKSKRTRKAR